jgi:hypothetical protein
MVPIIGGLAAREFRDKEPVPLLRSFVATTAVLQSLLWWCAIFVALLPRRHLWQRLVVVAVALAPLVACIVVITTTFPVTDSLGAMLSSGSGYVPAAVFLLVIAFAGLGYIVIVCLAGILGMGAEFLRILALPCQAVESPGRRASSTDKLELGNCQALESPKTVASSAHEVRRFFSFFGGSDDEDAIKAALKEINMEMYAKDIIKNHGTIAKCKVLTYSDLRACGVVLIEEGEKIINALKNLEPGRLER